MPELPEVETIKNILINVVKNNTITKIDVLRNCTIQGDQEKFLKSLTGQTFLNITRYGKYLFFHLTNNLVLISHLRMEGKYFDLLENEPNTYFSRVVFHLSNGHKLCYDDSRCFGIMILSDEENYKKEKEIAKLGPEPFDVKDVSEIYNRAKKSNLPMKSMILDQSLMAGIGNIYADETLFATKIHPLTPAKYIDEYQWTEIVKNAKRILKNAIQEGGSTIKSYHPGKDIDGNFQTRLLAYGKSGQNCPNCGTPFKFIKVGGRGTTFCPNCQIKKVDQYKIAITGKISSGKSTVLNIFKQNGYRTFSCDDIVKNVYKEDEVINQINAMFSLKFTCEVDKKILREYLLTHPGSKEQLEQYIHPIIIKRLNELMKKSNTKIIAVEVPLLYESHMEDYFDGVIFVDISEEARNIRLKARNPKSAEELAKINALNTHYEKNKNKADFIVTNNGDIDALNEQINNIICKVKID